MAQKEGVSRVKKWFQNLIGLNDWKDGVALNCNRADHGKKSLGKIIAYLYAFENDSVENENTVEGEMKNYWSQFLRWEDGFQCINRLLKSTVGLSLLIGTKVGDRGTDAD